VKHPIRFKIFETSRKHTNRPPKNLLGLLREYGADGHWVLTVKSFCSCTDVCVRIGGAKPQPFTVGVVVSGNAQQVEKFKNIGTRINTANFVLRGVYRFVVTNRELSYTAKLERSLCRSSPMLMNLG